MIRRKYRALKYNESFRVEQYFEINIDGKYSEKHIAYHCIGLKKQDIAQEIAENLNNAIDNFITDNNIEIQTATYSPSGLLKLSKATN